MVTSLNSAILGLHLGQLCSFIDIIRLHRFEVLILILKFGTNQILVGVRLPYSGVVGINQPLPSLNISFLI